MSSTILAALGSGGLPRSTARLISAAATTNPTLVCDHGCDLYQLIGYNAAAALRYLKIYNVNAAPTVGTTVPVLTFVLPATSPFNIPLSPLGLNKGLGYAFTTAAADADTGALTAGDITGFNVLYAG